MSRIAYVEVSSFYASVERLDDPGLRGRPTLVGGSPKKAGKVQSASLEAIESGVTVGMACERALELCSNAALVPTNMKRYREVSSLLLIALRKETEGIEADGLSGAYLEVPASHAAADEQAVALDLAARLQARVRDELGLLLSVGIAPVKFLARLAAEEQSESRIHCIAESDVASFLASQPVERLPGVGAKTRTQLSEMRVKTVAELLALSPRKVEASLGRHGQRILAYARGEDDSRVRTALHQKTLSHEMTFDKPIVERAAVEALLTRLCQTAETSLRQQQLFAARVAIKLRFGPGKPETRSRKLVRPIGSAAEILAAASKLLDRTEVGRRPLELLGIALAGLGPPTETEATAQLDLFE